MIMDGAAIGDGEFVQAHLRSTTDEAIKDMHAVEKALLLPGKRGETHPETAWVLLRRCILPKYDHHLRTGYPTDTKPQAARAPTKTGQEAAKTEDGREPHDLPRPHPPRFL